MIRNTKTMRSTKTMRRTSDGFLSNQQRFGMNFLSLMPRERANRDCDHPSLVSDCWEGSSFLSSPTCLMSSLGSTIFCWFWFVTGIIKCARVGQIIVIHIFRPVGSQERNDAKRVQFRCCFFALSLHPLTQLNVYYNYFVH